MAGLVIHKLAEKGAPRQVNPRTGEERFPLAGIRIESEVPKEHEFSASFVADAVADGWMKVTPKTLTIHAEDGDVKFKIVKQPGRYDKSGKRIGPPTPRDANLAKLGLDEEPDPTHELFMGYGVEREG